MKATPKRDKLINLFVLLASGVLVLILLETALALFHPRKITAGLQTERSFFCEYHPLLGWANKPNHRGVVRVDEDTLFTVTHNSLGQRGSEYPPERTPGVPRIVACGDSFVWGWGVQDNEVFTALLERMPPRPEVINMGVSGYGTGQELLLFMEEGRRFAPDLAVLGFFAPNDLAEVTSSTIYSYPKPVYVPGSDPVQFENVPVPRTPEMERVLYDNPATAWGKTKKFLRRHTHTYPFVASRLNSVPSLRRFFLLVGLAEEFTGGPQEGLSVFRVQEAREAWRSVFTMIRAFRDVARENGTEFLLVNIPKRETVPGGSLSDVSDETVGMNNIASDMVRRFTEENGVHFMDLTGPVRLGRDRGVDYYSARPRDIHLNAEGHRLLAELVAAWFQKNVRVTPHPASGTGP